MVVVDPLAFWLLCVYSYLFSFLVRVAANADKNKMAPTVIATVFAPALLRFVRNRVSLHTVVAPPLAVLTFPPPHSHPVITRRADQDPIAAMADTPKINSIVVVLIQEFEYVFRVRLISSCLSIYLFIKIYYINY